MNEKIMKALEACNKVLEGLENETLSISSALMLCLKIARLTNDENNLSWLMYESSGYAKIDNDNLLPEAFEIAKKHGRNYIIDDKEYVFTELVPELESKIECAKMQTNNFTTNGASTSGNYAMGAMHRLTESVASENKKLLTIMTSSRKKLMILASQFYDYALKKSIEITFGNVSQTIFESYRETVNGYLNDVSKDTLMKLQAIDEGLQTNNKETYSQILTTCRRLFQELVKNLFKRVLPEFQDDQFKTKSGKFIDVSGEHYKNKLSAIIETLEDKTLNKSLVGTSILYYMDWIDNLTSLQSKGVHNDISLEEARSCIIQTYIFAGEIIKLYENNFKNID